MKKVLFSILIIFIWISILPDYAISKKKKAKPPKKVSIHTKKVKKSLPSAKVEEISKYTYSLVSVKNINEVAVEKSLKEIFKNKLTILYFFSGDSVSCREEIPLLAEFAKKCKEYLIIPVAISSATDKRFEKTKEFIRESKGDVLLSSLFENLLYDEKKEIYNLFNADLGLAFIIDKNGNIISKWTRKENLNLWLEDNLCGTLYVESTPPDAFIYINNKIMGKTPKSITLCEGKYKIVLKKDNYEDFNTEVEAKIKKLTNITANLRPSFGFLTVSSFPSDAMVYVNGEIKCTKTPCTIDTLPGKYQVLIKKENYKDYFQNIEVIPNKVTTVKVTLEKIEKEEVGKIVSKEELEKEKVEQDKKEKCPRCNTDIKPNAKFCSNCGEYVGKKEIECSKCNASNPGHAKFCRKCGTAIQQ